MGTEKLRKSPTINFSSLPLAVKEFRPDSSIRLPSYSSFTTFISDAPVRNLGVTFDPHMSHSPTSPAPASCTYAICAVSDSCLTLKLHPPLQPPSSTQN